MKKILVILFIFCFAILPVQAKKRQSETVITPMKQLEKRSFQTKNYNSADKNTIIKAMLNVYQDEGFIIYNVNPLLGFIYGTKDYDISDSETDISKEFGLTKSRLSFNGVNVATLETTANLTEYGENLRVRINFRRKLLNTYGTAQFIEDINDAQYYEEFFNKIDAAIELQKQHSKKQAPAPIVKKEEPVEKAILETPKEQTKEIVEEKEPALQETKEE